MTFLQAKKHTECCSWKSTQKTDLAYTIKSIVNLLFIFAVLLLSSALAFAIDITSGSSGEVNEEILLLELSGDEEIVSLATGTPQPVSKAPSVATVITADEIRFSGAKTVQEVLERVPGLHIGLSKQNRLKQIFSIRGIHTGQNPQALILFNGHEIPSTFSGSIHPNLYLPVENISRIEIIRGPGSAVSGADAFSGVINIITKDHTEIDGVRSGIKVGSFATENAWVQYGGKLTNNWNLAVSMEYSQSEGDKSRIVSRDAQSRLDEIFATEASLAPGPLSTRYKALVTGLTLSRNHWTLQFNGWNQRDTGVGAGAANAIDPKGFTRVDQYLFSTSYEEKIWKSDLLIKAVASYEYSDIDVNLVVFPPGATLPIGTDGNVDFINPAGLVNFTDGLLGNPNGIGNVARIDLVGIYKGYKSHQWRFNTGIKHVKETDQETKNFGPGVIDGTSSPIDGSLTDVTGTPYIFHSGSSRSVSYVSVQDEWYFAPDWLLTGGIRYDHFSDVGGTTNPRLSLVWNTRHDLTSKLLYGRAFRAPTFSELNAINNPVVTGNANLNPEIIDTYELVFDYRPTSAFSSALNIFYYEIDGLIEFVDDDGLPGGNLIAQNATDQKGRGFELEFNWWVNRQLVLFGNVAYQNAKNQFDDEIPDAPKKQIHLGARLHVNPQLMFQLDAFRIMDRARPAGDTREEIPDFNWLNLTANISNFLKGLDLQFAIRNLGNSDASEPAPASVPNDYPLEKRSVFLGVSLNMK